MSQGKSAEYLRTVLTDEVRYTGAKMKRFIRPNIHENHNKVLYALLYANDIKLSELAEYLFVNTRTVQRWVTGIYRPNFFYEQRLSELLEIDKEMLFGSAAYNYTDIPRLELEGVNRTYMVKSKIRPVVKKTLFGLLWIYNLTTYQVSYITGIHQDNIGRLIYTHRMPKKDHPTTIKLMELFNMPYEILFMNFKNYDIRSKLGWYKDEER